MKAALCFYSTLSLFPFLFSLGRHRVLNNGIVMKALMEINCFAARYTVPRDPFAAISLDALEYVIALATCGERRFGGSVHIHIYICIQKDGAITQTALCLTRDWGHRQRRSRYKGGPRKKNTKQIHLKIHVRSGALRLFPLAPRPLLTSPGLSVDDLYADWYSLQDGWTT